MTGRERPALPSQRDTRAVVHLIVREETLEIPSGVAAVCADLADARRRAQLYAHRNRCAYRVVSMPAPAERRAIPMTDAQAIGLPASAS